MNRRLCAALVAMALYAPSAHAYGILTGGGYDPLAWTEGVPVTWTMAANGSDDVTVEQARDAIQAAFDSWEEIACSSITFQFGGLVNANPSNGIFLRWLEQSWDMTTQDALGVTTNWQLNGNGSAKKVEIFFNGVAFTWAIDGADDPFTNVNDIQAVAAHEIGHAIGFSHSRHREATMWFTSYPGQSEAARSLEPDDQRAACFLYPAVPFTDGRLCDSCTSHGHCQSGSCIDYGAEGAHCGQDCSASQGCPDGYDCYQLNGGGAPQCIPVNEHCKNVGSNIPAGQFCYDHVTCASGLCLVLPDSAVCSQDCNPSANGGCPVGMGCVGQGTDGVCFPKGNVALGGACTAPSDCASIQCVGIGQGQGVCTAECSSDANCPSPTSCVSGLCIEAGNKAFGEDCETSLECGSFYCPPFLGYCSDSCESSADCPAGVECEVGFGGGSGYCDAGATGQVGESCGPQAKECVTGLFCLYANAGASLGECAEKCDARFDNCSGDRYCQWVWQDWAAKVVGVCRDDNGGAGPNEPCGGSTACRPDLVCADTDGTGARCRHDCNGNNGIGCPSGSSCVHLNLDDNPKLGACHPKDGRPAVEEPQVVETPNVAEPPPADDDLGGVSTGTTGAEPDAGGLGIDPGGSGAGSDGGDSGTDGGTTGRERSSGGCYTSGTPASSPWALLLLSCLGVLAVRREVA